MSITMEDPIGSYWATKSHAAKVEEIRKQAERINYLEEQARFTVTKLRQWSEEVPEEYRHSLRGLALHLESVLSRGVGA